MIFVTVGTTSFDKLIEEVDRFSLENNGDDKIICQIGNGVYIPEYCEYFRFKPNIDQMVNDAEIVITHGGTTVINLILAGKRFVAIANTDLADDHQSRMLKKINSVRSISWSDDVSRLSFLINSEKNKKREKGSRVSFDRLVGDITSYISN